MDCYMRQSNPCSREMAFFFQLMIMDKGESIAAAMCAMDKMCVSTVS